jgi:nickel/cobalt exporter
MPGFETLIAQGTAHAWLFIPSAILLGALHGLEPGHSKTMMAAFIIAIRGTVAQAVMLGLAATVSHTIVVWAIALGGLYFYKGLNAGAVEPYLQLVSGIIIIAMALWMIQRTRRDVIAERAHNHHHHDHAHGLHDHDHSHVHAHGDHDHHRHDYDHSHDGHNHHGHDHRHAGYEDAHARAHADDIRRRFGMQQNVTNWQIALFGFTGGLIPCPAAITVLLLCLQLREIPLGAALVLCFSIGLAITLVLVGATAAIGVRHAAQRIAWFSTFARRAPYFSGVLLIAVGLYVGWHGYEALVL